MERRRSGDAIPPARLPPGPRVPVRRAGQGRRSSVRDLHFPWPLVERHKARRGVRDSQI
jgi:hypothetical protein